VVDQLGNPKAPATNPNGTPHNGVLRYASVFGPLPDIQAGPIVRRDRSRRAWIPSDHRSDPSGYVKKVLG